jgi:hypothetical protein
VVSKTEQSADDFSHQTNLAVRVAVIVVLCQDSTEIVRRRLVIRSIIFRSEK